MKGSFGGPFPPFGGDRGINGGGMLRAASRVVARTGVTGSGGGFPESLSASANSTSTSPGRASGHGHKLNSKKQLSLSSSSSPMAAPRSASSLWPLSQHDDYFWVSADDGSEDERGENAHFEEFLLGPAPSSDEVHSAVSALQQVFDSTTDIQFVRDRFGPNLDMEVGTSSMMRRVSSAGSDLDWIEPNFHLCNSRSLQLFGYGFDSDSVVDAFRLLRTDSSVQQMVVSLSQDRAVWDAVMNNEVVRELREACYGIGVEISTTFPDETNGDRADEADPVIDFLRQVMNHTKIKLKDVIEKITKLVSDLFKLLLLESPTASVEDETKAGVADSMEGKLRASFMMCIVVLLIVVVSRARGA